MASETERLSFEDWPGGPVSLAVQGDAGAVQFYPGRTATLHFHRPGPGAGERSDCFLLPGGQCWEEISISRAALLAAELEEAGAGHEAAYRRLEELYEQMAAEAAQRQNPPGGTARD